MSRLMNGFGFRPLDGESISKLSAIEDVLKMNDEVSVP